MTTDKTTLARLAINEAARLCDAPSLQAARDALRRDDWEGAIRAAVNAAHAAGRVVGERVRNSKSGDRVDPAVALKRFQYRAAINRLALKLRAPTGEVEAVASTFSRDILSVKRAIARARQKIIRAKVGIASASGLRARIR